MGWIKARVLFTNPGDPDWGDDYTRQVSVYDGEWAFEEFDGELTFRKITDRLPGGTPVVNVGDCTSFHMTWEYEMNALDMDWLMAAPFSEVVERLASNG